MMEASILLRRTAKLCHRSVAEIEQQRLVMRDLPFREDKTNKDWENSVEGRQLSAGGVKATTPLYSETKTRK
jgi:hypothetical protein